MYISSSLWNSLKHKVNHILGVLKANENPYRFAERITRRRERPSHHTELESRGENWISIPYLKGMSEAISNILRPLNIQVAHCASPWKWTVCSGIKDKIPQCEQKGVVYRVPCKNCDSVSVGEMLGNLKVRL